MRTWAGPRDSLFTYNKYKNTHLHINIHTQTQTYTYTYAHIHGRESLFAQHIHMHTNAHTNIRGRGLVPGITLLLNGELLAGGDVDIGADDEDGIGAKAEEDAEGGNPDMNTLLPGLEDRVGPEGRAGMNEVCEVCCVS